MLLNVLQKKMMEEHISYLETFGLTKQHIPYLMILWNHKEGISQTDMIDQIHFDKAHASRALKDLLLKKIIVKEDINTYKNKYFLSESGLEIAQKIKLQNKKIHEEIFSILTDEERIQIENIVKKLTDHLVGN